MHAHHMSSSVDKSELNGSTRDSCITTDEQQHIMEDITSTHTVQHETQHAAAV
jgi:hypothetical protein